MEWINTKDRLPEHFKWVLEWMGDVRSAIDECIERNK